MIQTNLSEFLQKKVQLDTKKCIQTKCGFCQKDTQCQDIFGPNFTNLDFLYSRYICENCAFLFDDDLRKNCFYIYQENNQTVIQKIKQNEFADIIRNPKLPCILGFSESRKMHRLFKAKVNYTKQDFAIQCDKIRVNLDLDKDIKLMNDLEKLYNKYELSKSWLINGDIPPPYIIKMGQDYFRYKEITQNLIGDYKLNTLVAFINSDRIFESKT